MATQPLAIVQEMYRELRPRAPLPGFCVEFYAFANVNNTIRLRQGRVLIRLSDLLEGAPEAVLRAIVHILLAKLYGKHIDPNHAARYRRHISSRDLARKTHVVRQMRGRKRLLSSQGHVFDLHEIFDSLNQRYFGGLLGRPQMTWSALASRTNLGHYDPAHNTIVVSRIFDRLQVPRYVVEYLVYHEMLHLRYPVKLRGSRRCVHSAGFQEEEKRFPEFEAAKKFLLNGL